MKSSELMRHGILGSDFRMNLECMGTNEPCDGRLFSESSWFFNSGTGFFVSVCGTEAYHDKIFCIWFLPLSTLTMQK